MDQTCDRVIDGSVVTFGPGAEVINVNPIVPKDQSQSVDITSSVDPDVGCSGLGKTDHSNITPGSLTTRQINECATCGAYELNADSLSCGHRYCPDCFTHMCASADPPLHCTKIAVFTTGNVCKKKITLPELEARLGHESFERLLKSSLGKYLRRNPETFIYCNTPDCPQVMRRISDATRESVEATKNTRAESAQTFKCNLCHAITCLTCEAPDHTTISCQDNQARIKLENTQLEAWKQTNTAKDCPKCKCAIEIIDGGCLHMKCENCGQHFCWKCMVGLDDGKHAYEHNKYIHLGHMP